jgi:glycosyltransferase involved in cell wall biosynthesis
VIRLAPLLEERGWRLAFWAPRPSALYEYLRDRGFEVNGEPRPIDGFSLRSLRTPPGLRTRLGRAPRYFARLRSLIREQRPALVHANSLYAVTEAAVARRQGVPTVIHVHEMIRDNRKGRIARRLVFRFGDDVIAVSEAAAEALSFAANRPRVVHECAPLPPAAPDRSGRVGRTVVGTIGVVSPRKGSDLFVAAARELRRRGEQIDFRLVGGATAPLEAEWARALIDELPDAGIDYAPRVDVPLELAALDVFVLPSREDPFPIVVLEAMGSGLPVVGTRVDGLAEQITPETGLLVAPDDPIALADAIVTLHRDPELRRRLGAGGRRRVAERFTLEQQAAGLDAAYAAALAGR